MHSPNLPSNPVGSDDASMEEEEETDTAETFSSPVDADRVTAAAAAASKGDISSSSTSSGGDAPSSSARPPFPVPREHNNYEAGGNQFNIESIVLNVNAPSRFSIASAAVAAAETDEEDFAGDRGSGKIFLQGSLVRCLSRAGVKFEFGMPRALFHK